MCPTPVPQLKVLEGEGRQQKEELQEVHGRLSQEEQKEEEARREAFTLRQRVVECEAGREAALQEVRFWRCAHCNDFGVLFSTHSRQGVSCVS